MDFHTSHSLTLILSESKQTFTPKKKTRKQQQNLGTKMLSAIRSLLTTTYVVFTLLLLPVLLTFFGVCWIYRCVVASILKLRLRRHYGGLLSGPDTFWTLKDDSKPIINALLLVNFKPSAGTRLSDAVAEHLKENLYGNADFQKLFCTTDKFLGYSYLIKNRVDLNDYVSVFEKDKYKSRRALEENLGLFGNVGLPKNGRALWEVLIGNEPIPWSPKPNHPLIVRFHHSVGDGIALLQLLLTSFERKLPTSHISTPCESDDVTQKLVKASIRCMQFAVVLWQLPMVLLKRISSKDDDNCIHGRRLSGEKVIAWKTESRAKYVKVVKRIKDKMKGAGFFDIVAAAISASIYDLFKQLGDSNSSVSCIIPAVPNYIRYSNPRQLKEIKIDLTNRFSVGVLDLPINHVKADRCSERFWKVAKEIFELKKSHEYQVNYWVLNIAATVLPEVLLAPLVRSTQNTMVISNLPGPKQIEMFDGNAIEELVFWIPHKGLTGVAFSILTYNGKFHIGISIDKVFNVPQNQLEEILDGIFGYLDSLYEETTFLEDNVNSQT